MAQSSNFSSNNTKNGVISSSAAAAPDIRMATRQQELRVSNDENASDEVIDSLNEELLQAATQQHHQNEKFPSNDQYQSPLYNTNDKQTNKSSKITHFENVEGDYDDESLEKHQLEVNEAVGEGEHKQHDYYQEQPLTNVPPLLADNQSMSNLSPRQGVSFLEEFSRLPDFSTKNTPRNVKTASPAFPMGYRISQGVETPVLTLLGGPEEHQQTAPFYNVTLQDFVGKDVPLLIGELPNTEQESAQFWSAVNRLNVCGVVTVNQLRQDKGTETFSDNNNLPWPHACNAEVVFDRKICSKTIHVEVYRSFQSNLVRLQDLDYGLDRDIPTWSYSAWPTSGHSAVPPLPHHFLDFLRTIIQQTYFSCRAGQPLLIVDRNGLDIAGLTAAVMMLLYQACEQRRADVWRCVAELRGATRRNIVSKFQMYEFLYDCLLQVMCATPTIMSGNFKRAFRHLLRRGPPLVGSKSPRSQIGADGMPVTRRVAPILEQFDLVCSLSQMYRSRVVSQKFARYPPGSPYSSSSAGGALSSKRSQFEPRQYKSIRYFNLPSFSHSKHFISVRGIVHVNMLLELMAKRGSRTLLWFSETPRPDEILTGNQHDGILIGDVSAYGVFYSFEMEAPTSRGPWRITVIQFVGWPAFCGERPARPCRELVVTLRRVLEHADAVAESLIASRLPSDEPIQPTVTLYEAEAGCCTWRGAMAALAASLDQRMARFNEVDIFRTCQLYKIFEPDSIVISPKQYTWCFKIAWASYLLANPHERETEKLEATYDSPSAILKGSNIALIHGSSNQTIEIQPLDSCYSQLNEQNYHKSNLLTNPYGSEKCIYAYPNLREGSTEPPNIPAGMESPPQHIYYKPKQPKTQQHSKNARKRQHRDNHGKHSSTPTAMLA